MILVNKKGEEHVAATPPLSLQNQLLEDWNIDGNISPFFGAQFTNCTININFPSPKRSRASFEEDPKA